MTKVKEGQTYVCKRDKLAWWTKGQEYTVQKFSNGVLYITDDDGRDWYLPNDNLLNTVFKLKEKTFNLNTLTTAQLREYLGLLEEKEHAERSLNDFIERMTKYNACEGIEMIEYNDMNQYKITEDYLILGNRESGYIVYIQKDQVLEFEVNWQL